MNEFIAWVDLRMTMSRKSRILSSPSDPARQPGRKTVGLGLIGLGTVGTGTAKVLSEHQREVERRLGCRLELEAVCDVQQKDFSWLGRRVRVTKDWKQVVSDPRVDIVIELIGGISVAREVAFGAVRAGKHLVTANKHLVAEYGLELAEQAQAAKVRLGIEACVMGGTPLLHAVREGLSGEHFSAVFGILNGTTNYILTEMEGRGCGFPEALAEAQEKGYAERDPTFDVEGFDARYKITILAMMCFGQAVRVDKIPVEGITRIDQVDFTYAHRLEHTIRLIAGARRHGGGHLEIFVRPMMIPRASLLANVLGSLNGVLLVGNKGGNTTMTGRGAGGEPTGVAVLSDVVEIARAMTSGGGSAGAASPLGYTRWHRARLVTPGSSVVATYLRLAVRDRPGILARICALLARHRINIDSVLQEPGMPKSELPFVMILEPTQEEHVRSAVAQIARQPFMVQPPLLIPFAELP